MNSFDDVRLRWNDEAYVIPANRVLGAIARIEDVFTFHELIAYSQRGTAPIAKLAEAYGAILRYAGADVSDDSVYVGMFGNLSEGSGSQVQESIQTLMMMMIPKDKRKEIEAPGKPVRGRPRGSRVKPKTKASSKTRGAQSSARSA